MRPAADCIKGDNREFEQLKTFPRPSRRRSVYALRINWRFRIWGHLRHHWMLDAGDCALHQPVGAPQGSVVIDGGSAGKPHPAQLRQRRRGVTHDFLAVQTLMQRSCLKVPAVRSGTGKMRPGAAEVVGLPDKADAYLIPSGGQAAHRHCACAGYQHEGRLPDPTTTHSILTLILTYYKKLGSR